jgi:hypothetical protein
MSYEGKSLAKVTGGRERFEGRISKNSREEKGKSNADKRGISNKAIGRERS